MRPIALPPNQFPHFYQGGRGIERFRGLLPEAANMPEDWVGSTTTRFGSDRLGLSTLPDGRLLRDAIAADPVGWLGADHVEAFGANLALLVKLLDAGQRLIVHAHPDQQFAAQHLGCRNGKTEAWLVLTADSADAVVYVGFRDDVDPSVVRGWVDGQHIEALLASLNVLPVAAGDALLVPAGLPHAIGGGVMIVELQEPTDFSVALEWEGFDFDGPAAGHLGLGFDVALRCVDYTRCSPDRLSGLRGPADNGERRAPLLPAAADPFFRADRIRGGAVLEPSVAVLVVTSGSGELQLGPADRMEVRRGDTVIVPHAAGDTTVTGEVEMLRCRPADPATILEGQVA